ncbi:MAG: glycosyltransferase [Spirochaetota bacterium]
MKLAVFHYHLRQGGVAGVITQACIALGLHSDAVAEVILVAGSDENTDDVSSRIRDAAPGLGVSVRVHPELAYLSEQSDVSMAALEARIVSILTGNYLSEDIVWWVHNYHLGKNPAFTSALIDVLETEPGQRAVFQIHDFPECARFENLAELRSHVSGSVYPVLPNLVYATINLRDRRLLTEAGIPESAVFALPNPVPAPAPPGAAGIAGPAEAPEAPEGPDRSEVLHRLAGVCGERFPAFDPEGALVLYPVRAIRRKNVFEAGFLTRLLNSELSPPANLILTLPGTSPLEKPYSDMVQTAFEDGVLPGMAGIGTELEAAGLRFEDLTRAADLVVSTSVQEGFGYAFFEAPLRGTPLVARYLDVLNGLDHLFEGYPHAFYRELRVPFESPSIDSIRTILRIRYDEHLERAAGSMPEATRRRVEAEIAEMLNAATIDFSFLMPQIQYAYAKDLADDGFANEVRSLNFEVIGPLLRLLESPGRPRGVDTPSITAELGYAPYAARFETLLAHLHERSRSGNGTHGTGGAQDGAARTDGTKGPDHVQQRLLEAFAHKDYFRLLYGAVGE